MLAEFVSGFVIPLKKFAWPMLNGIRKGPAVPLKEGVEEQFQAENGKFTSKIPNSECPQMTVVPSAFCGPLSLLAAAVAAASSSPSSAAVSRAQGHATDDWDGREAFELRTKHKNPFYTSSEEETEDGEGMKTPKFENYQKIGQKSMQKTFGGEVTKKPIYLQLLLDGKVPVDQLISMEMPQELKNELRDWEAKFPDLRVDGKGADGCHAAREMRMLRREIARNIVEEHLWPELQSVLSSKKYREEQKHGKTPSKSKSPKAHKGSATAAGSVKLPPINRKF